MLFSMWKLLDNNVRLFVKNLFIIFISMKRLMIMKENMSIFLLFVWMCLCVWEWWCWWLWFVIRNFIFIRMFGVVNGLFK